MPNPNKKIDCEVVNKTYSVMCSCPPLEFAREIVGGKFTSLDYLDKTESVMSNIINEFDYDGSAGEYIVYPGYTHDYTTRKLLANTETQKKDFEVHSKEILEDLNELAASEKLNEYPAIKGFVEYRRNFLKAALEGTDRWAVLAEIPGGYGLSASPDWTQKKNGKKKDAKQFDDMLTGMKYGQLFAITDEYIDLELKMRNKVLTPEQLKECTAERIDQNNRMIEVYEHQKSPESKEKYSEFFQNFDDTIGGERGVDLVIGQLKLQNQALENGWDVSRLNMFLRMKDIATNCKNAQATFDHFHDPALVKAQGYSQKVANLDPTERKFESVKDFDKYMTEFHLAFTDLINEASKPEVHAAFEKIDDDLSTASFEYNRKMRRRQDEINKHANKSDYIAPPEPKKPETFDLEKKLFNDLGSDVNDDKFRNLREFAKCVDPAYYDLEGDEKAVEQRKAEIAEVKTPLMVKKGREYTSGQNPTIVDNLKNKKTAEIDKAQKYINSTLKASRLAAEKLKALPDPETIPERLKTFDYNEYVLSLKKVANIQNISRIFPEKTNNAIKALVDHSRELSVELENNNDKFSKEFRKSVVDSAEKFNAHYNEAKEKAEGFDKEQDMMAYIDIRKHEISCVEAAMNVDFTKDQIYDAGEKNRLNKAMKDLGADIQRSNDANHVFIRHNDYDDAVRAMNTLADDLKKYQDFIDNRKNSGNTEKEILEKTEKAAKAIRESADETTRKLKAYLERKGKEGDLNEKGRRRVEAFKKALETTRSIGYICDDRLIENDTKMMAIDNAEILKNDIKEADRKIFVYKRAANNEDLPDVEKLAALFAVASAQTLKDLAFGNHELNEEEMTFAKESIACITVFEKKLFDPNSNPTPDEYGAQVSELANDPAFVKAIDLSPNGIRDFIANKDITKEVSEIYDKYEQLEDHKDNNLENNGPKEEPLIPVDDEPVKEEHAVKEENIQAHANESKEFTKAVAADRENITKNVDLILNGSPSQKELDTVKDQMRGSMSRIVAASMLNASNKVAFDPEKIDPLANSIRNNANMDNIVNSYMNIDKYDELIQDANSLNGNGLKRQYLLSAEKSKQAEGNIHKNEQPVIRNELNKGSMLNQN